jgi:large subunit ribosomal protein L16
MFTKDRKGRVCGVKIYDEVPFFNSHKLISVAASRLTKEQLESARRVISRQIKRIGKYKIHVSPTVSVSAKPSEVRMGKGKGAIDHYIARIQAGQIIFSLEGVSPSVAENVLLKASRKLPMKTNMVQAGILLQYPV